MSHLGPNGGNLHSCTNNGVFNSGPQDPELQSTCPHPGPSSHPRQLSARPMFYIHAPAPPPPPPPFFHYPWSLPMPLFYNPLEGFPGMGYGLVMPPFPPYMETPAYIMHHPHVQPMDYRRLLHPQVHAPTASYQNPNQTRRIRPPRSVPTETVNSEVQTEPTERGHDDYGDRSPLVRSDSGHGTASVSPSSSSSSKKRDSTEANNFESLGQQGRSSTSRSGDLQNNNITLKHGFNSLHPTASVGTSSTETLEEPKNHEDGGVQTKVDSCQYGHCKVWSVSSSDSIVPVCSSSQQDGVLKERLASISNIQRSWGSVTPQATVLNVADEMLPSETLNGPDKSVNQSPGEADRLFSKECECLYKILKLPLAQSRDDTESHEMSSSNVQIRKKLNESVWSVDSLPPFIPTREWLAQNGMFDPEVIEEMVEEVESCQLAQNVKMINTGKRIGDALKTKSPSSENEATLLNSPRVEQMAAENGICEQLCPPVEPLKMVAVSPRGHLVDCGIQCDQLQEIKCLCEEIKSSIGARRGRPFRLPDVRTSNGGIEEFYMNGQKNQKRPGQWRNRSPERPTSQQALNYGLPGKTGKRGERSHK